MRMLVFVTNDGNSPEGTGPVAYLRDAPEASLPPHPRSLTWRYFATMDSADIMVEDERPQLVAALQSGASYISQHLIAGRRLASFDWMPSTGVDDGRPAKASARSAG